MFLSILLSLSTSLTNWISWVVFGLLAGAAAKMIKPGADPGGFVGTALIGVAGAILGGYLTMLVLEMPIEENWSVQGFLAAILGAVIILFIWKQIGRNLK